MSYECTGSFYSMVFQQINTTQCILLYIFLLTVGVYFYVTRLLPRVNAGRALPLGLPHQFERQTRLIFYKNNGHKFIKYYCIILN